DPVRDARDVVRLQEELHAGGEVLGEVDLDVELGVEALRPGSAGDLVTGFREALEAREVGLQLLAARRDNRHPFSIPGEGTACSLLVITILSRAASRRGQPFSD